MIDRISEDNLPLTERQAAERLGVSLSTLRRRRRAAKGPRYFRDGGIIRYFSRDVDKYVADHLTPEVAR